MATEDIGLDISTEGADTVHKLLNNSTTTRFKTVKCCGKEKLLTSGAVLMITVAIALIVAITMHFKDLNNCSQDSNIGVTSAQSSNKTTKHKVPDDIDHLCIPQKVVGATKINWFPVHIQRILQTCSYHPFACAIHTVSANIILKICTENRTKRICHLAVGSDIPSSYDMCNSSNNNTCLANYGENIFKCTLSDSAEPHVDCSHFNEKHAQFDLMVEAEKQKDKKCSGEFPVIPVIIIIIFLIALATGIFLYVIIGKDRKISRRQLDTS
ncbi:unnamed protein product [Mytilus edulis]|uniref:Uncharacterized protein n=1 Tax=Mytilus edulis TaxID=6550 RepID=A0A8S3TQC7_MYTED|nr:unnamed protein product [Mytilus edulis]